MPEDNDKEIAMREVPQTYDGRPLSARQAEEIHEIMCGAQVSTAFRVAGRAIVLAATGHENITLGVGTGPGEGHVRGWNPRGRPSEAEQPAAARLILTTELSEDIAEALYLDDPEFDMRWLCAEFGSYDIGADDEMIDPDEHWRRRELIEAAAPWPGTVPTWTLDEQNENEMDTIRRAHREQMEAALLGAAREAHTLLKDHWPDVEALAHALMIGEVTSWTFAGQTFTIDPAESGS
ncbi:MAG: hypothetical protein DLM64_06100 [Solirubrobacterales bacterium]|nr:MAG: hypothetical protein DLM64_06100 [Solirubrobacterales bacterium]